MKKCLAIVLTILMLSSLALADTAERETPVFAPTEDESELLISGDLFPGDEYEITGYMTRFSADLSIPWIDLWTQYYNMSSVSYLSTETGEQEEGWIVSGFVPQPMDEDIEPAYEFSILLQPSGDGFPAFEAVNKALPPYSYESFGNPSEEVIPLENAFRTALDAVIEAFGETPATLLRFYVEYGYALQGENQQIPAWQFDFVSDIHPIDGYGVQINAQDGTLLWVASSEDGLG